MKAELTQPEQEHSAVSTRAQMQQKIRHRKRARFFRGMKTAGLFLLMIALVTAAGLAVRHFVVERYFPAQAEEAAAQGAPVLDEPLPQAEEQLQTQPEPAEPPESEPIPEPEPEPEPDGQEVPNDGDLDDEDIDEDEDEDDEDDEDIDEDDGNGFVIIRNGSEEENKKKKGFSVAYLSRYAKTAAKGADLRIKENAKLQRRKESLERKLERFSIPKRATEEAVLRLNAEKESMTKELAEIEERISYNYSIAESLERASDEYAYIRNKVDGTVIEKLRKTERIHGEKVEVDQDYLNSLIEKYNAAKMANEAK